MGAALLSSLPLGLARIDLDDYETTDLLEAGIEIVLLWWFFYVVLRFLHGTRGLAIMKGILLGVVAIVLGLVLVSLTLDVDFSRLQVAGTYLLQVIVIVLIVLFQPELRRGFTRLSESRGRRKGDPGGDLAETLEAFSTLSNQATGALVVFEGSTGIQGIQDSGEPINAAVSGALIESIFYPKSPLHDGAVIIRDGRIVAASCMLPLTDDPTISRSLGTRHRAAIGVTEESDAVAVVVSEETGRITVVHHGALHPADDRAALAELMARFVEGFDHEEDEEDDG